MSEQVEKLLIEVAEKFGTTVEHLWGVLVRQAVIESATSLILTTAVAVIGGIATKWVIGKICGKNPDWDFSEEWQIIPFIALAIFWVIVIAVIIPSVFVERVPALLNPEYWALKQLLP